MFEINSGLVHVRWILSIILMASGVLLAEDPKSENSCWTQINIERAFVSKKTTRQYKDFFSNAEFGWQIKNQTGYLFRADLYGNLYAPGCDFEDLHLNFVEVDLFSDDFISSVKLDKNKSRYLLTKNDDYVVLNFSEVYPDSDSGTDQSATGAIPIKSEYTGSVNFLKGDYTDYLQTSPESAAVFLHTPFPGAAWKIVAGESEIHPSPKKISSFYFIKGQNLLVQIRGRVGGLESVYHVKSFVQKNLEDELFKHVLETGLQQSHYNSFVELADILISWKSEYFRIKCKEELSRLKQTRKRVLCSIVLYRIAYAEDISYLQAIYSQESDEYQKIVSPAYKRSLKDRIENTK